MPSVVDICNIALGNIGATANVVSIAPANGAEAIHCARYWPIARRLALTARQWTWNKTRAALAPAPANPSDIWTYAYALPSTCIKPLRVLQLAYVNSVLMWPPLSGPLNDPLTADEFRMWDERGSSLFEIEDQVLLTHEPDAVLLFQRDITDTTVFSDAFVDYVAWLMSGYLAGPIIKGIDGANAAAKLRSEVIPRALALAAAQDANSTHERNDHVPAHLRGR